MPGLANFGNSKQLAFKYTFDMQTTQPKPRCPQLSLFYQVCIPWASIHLPYSLQGQAGNRQLRVATTFPEPTEIIQL